MNHPYADVVATQKFEKPVGDTVVVHGIEIIHSPHKNHGLRPYVLYRGQKFIARIGKKERQLLIERAGVIG